MRRRNARPDEVDLGRYLDEVCLDLNEIAHCSIHVEARGDVPIATDRAIPIALIELITNATKYAYEGRRGQIFVRLSLPADDVIELAVRDEGVGLPRGFELRPSFFNEVLSKRVGKLRGGERLGDNGGRSCILIFLHWS